MINQQDLKKTIPTFKNGKIINERFMEIHRLLSSYVYDQRELKIFEAEINTYYVHKEELKEARKNEMPKM